MYRRSEGGRCSASPSFWRKCFCAQHNPLQYFRVLGCVAIGRQRLNAAVSRSLNATHILCGDLCCHPPDVPQRPCAAKRREVGRMVRGCGCVAEWLELGQAPGYECGCCMMVLCGPAVAVCRVEGPGRVQSAHSSGRPSVGPYSLGVSCCRPRRWRCEVTGGGGRYFSS